jgi:hypothetical protein
MGNEEFLPRFFLGGGGAHGIIVQGSSAEKFDE